MALVAAVATPKGVVKGESVTDEDRPGSLAGPIVGTRQWNRRDARPRVNIARVTLYPDGELQVQWPDEPSRPFLARRPVGIYEVDISPQRSTFSVDLPSRNGRTFHAEIFMEWRVVDPAAVVRARVRDVAGTISPELEQRAMAISARFGLDEAAAAEDEINRQLRGADWPGWRGQGDRQPGGGDYLGAEYGLWARPLVRLTVTEGLTEWEMMALRGMHEAQEFRLHLSLDRHMYKAAAILARLRAGELSVDQTVELVAKLVDRTDLDEESKERLLRLLKDRWETKPPDSEALETARPPASPPVTYDDVVRRAYAELVEPGRLLFNPPDRMLLGKTARVEVRLTRTLLLDSELIIGLTGLGEPHVEDVPAASLMAVTLQGDGFKITSYSDEEQRVAQDQITTWEFDIKALKRGMQRLVISVSLRIPVPGQSAEHKSIPVREATIEVRVGATAAAHFVSANWQWFVATAIAIGGLITAIVVH